MLSDILANSNFISTKKVLIIDVEIWTVETYYSLLKPHLGVQIRTVTISTKFLRKYMWRSASFKKVATVNTVTSLTVNSVMDIFLKILQIF